MAADETEVFDLQGRRMNVGVDELPAGVYIVRKGVEVRKVAVR